jgi:phospholipase/lecithinase/hemolysin
MPSSWTSHLLAANLAFAVGFAGRSSQCWKDGQFKTLVTFGDSYTDENRLNYFGSHNGSAPPIGWDQPVGLATASGGLSWARYASIYSQATLYNYAVSGAVCSNQITPRTFSNINAFFPDIAGYEVPTYITESKYVRPNGTKFFTGKPDSTVYAIWIGTNDLGNNAFLTDSQVEGKTVADYMDCVYDQVGRLYENGARYFVLLNLAPLNLLPQYALPKNGGLSATQYFPEKEGKNATEISGRMQESVAALNQVYKYRTPFEVDVEETWDDIKVANFDVNSLMTDIYYNASKYLNGTAPPNVQGVVNVCNTQGANCTKSSSPDSYEWYDPLHPSEQTSRVVAREFVSVIGGESKYATYWG